MLRQCKIFCLTVDCRHEAVVGSQFGDKSCFTPGLLVLQFAVQKIRRLSLKFVRHRVLSQKMGGKKNLKCNNCNFLICPARDKIARAAFIFEITIQVATRRTLRWGQGTAGTTLLKF